MNTRNNDINNIWNFQYRVIVCYLPSKWERSITFVIKYVVYRRKILWCSGIFRENVVIFRDIPPYSVIFRHSGFSQRPYALRRISMFAFGAAIWYSGNLYNEPYSCFWWGKLVLLLYLHVYVTRCFWRGNSVLLVLARYSVWLGFVKPISIIVTGMLCVFSINLLVAYHVSCVPIGYATSRLLVIAYS